APSLVVGGKCTWNRRRRCHRCVSELSKYGQTRFASEFTGNEPVENPPHPLESWIGGPARYRSMDLHFCLAAEGEARSEQGSSPSGGGMVSSVGGLPKHVCRAAVETDGQEQVPSLRPSPLRGYGQLGK